LSWQSAASSSAARTGSRAPGSGCSQSWLSLRATRPTRFIATAPAGREQALTSVFCVAALVFSMGYFSYEALNFADTTALDHGLATLLHHDPNCHTIQVVPYGFEVKPIGRAPT